eukprot:gene32857-42536_t
MLVVSAAIALVVLCQTLHLVSSHGRWKCPSSRDANDESGAHISFDNTGNKYAACGPQSGKWGFGTVTTIQPGWNTIVWEESISHKGSPFRVAILDETETARAVLLDHIPHNDDSAPDSNNESTYTPYKMSVFVPDVLCSKCSLQLLYLMTDKTTNCGIDTCFYNPADAACKGSTNEKKVKCLGAPNSNVCVEENECFSNYHSCTDVIITGTQPITSFSMDSQPLSWPYKNITMQYYRSESSKWSNGWLQNLPTEFTTDYATLKC